MQDAAHSSGRLFGLVFLAIVGVTITLLIAGYGVAVGVGALAGLFLGGLAGSLGVLWLARGSGRSMVFGNSIQWSSDGPDDAAMAEMREFGEIASIDLGAILSVTPVLTTAAAAGRTIQLVAIEHREAGLAMTFALRTGPGTMPPGGMARVVVTDDAGTDYRAAVQSEGGSPAETRYRLVAFPSPPLSAATLLVRIERFFDPFPAGAREMPGPWEFSVPLRSTAPD